jgi:hypothetical protein
VNTKSPHISTSFEGENTGEVNKASMVSLGFDYNNSIYRDETR